MLNKVSSAKYLSHSNFQSPSNIPNWQNMRKDMLSTRQIQNNCIPDNPSTNNRLMQLFKIIEQERIERQKDILTLNQKIKLIKCKHQVVTLDAKQKINKNSSNVFVKTVQSINNQNQFNVKKQYDINQSSKCKLVKEDQQVKFWLKDFKCQNQIVKDKLIKLQQKIKQLQKQTQRRNRQHLNQQNLCEKQVYQLDKHIELVNKQHEQLKQKIVQNMQNINTKFLHYTSQNNIQLSKNINERIGQIQQNFNQNLKQSQERNVKQLGALGQIIDKNLQLMHKTISNQLTTLIQNKLKQHNEQLQLNSLQIIKQLQYEQEKLKKICQTIELNMFKNNQKIILQFQLISENLSSLQQKYQLLAKRQLQNSRIFLKTQQTLNSNNCLQSNPSILINNFHQKNQEKEIVIGEGIKFEAVEQKLAKINQNIDKKISDIMQLFGQNCTFLQTRNLTIEQSVADVVHLISDLLIKFKKYI